MIDPKRCTGCKLCLSTCPVEAIRMENGKAVIDQYLCEHDGICIPACPYEAIDYQPT